MEDLIEDTSGVKQLLAVPGTEQLSVQSIVKVPEIIFIGLVISLYLSLWPVAHLSDAPPIRRLVVTGDSARIQDETTENST